MPLIKKNPLNTSIKSIGPGYQLLTANVPPGATANALKNGVVLGAATVNAKGSASYGPVNVATDDIISFAWTLTGSTTNYKIPAPAGTVTPIGPSTATFMSDAPAGTVIWTPSTKNSNSTLTFFPNDGRIAVDSSGRLVIGLTASSVGNITGSVSETLSGDSGSSRTTNITISVTSPISSTFSTKPVITGTPLSGEPLTVKVGNLGSGTGQWYSNNVAVSGATASTYLLQDSDIGNNVTYKYTPNGKSTVTSTPTDVVQQSTLFVDESGNVLTDENGNPLTPGYNYSLSIFTDENGNLLTDENGSLLGDYDYTPVSRQLRVLAPYSTSQSSFNQLTDANNPFTFALDDTDQYVTATTNVPIQAYAPNMFMLKVFSSTSTAIATFYPDALGYFSGTIDLSSYPNGPQWFELRAYNKSTEAASSIAIYAGFHLFITGGSNANTSALPAGASGLALKFVDDFSSLSVSRSATNDGSLWYDQMPDNKNFGDQIFTAASSAQNPFKIVGTFLRIREKYDVNFAGGSSGLKHWFSGLLSAAFPDGTTNIPTGNGYYECRMLIPFGSGTWPAFWMENLDRVKDSNTKQYSSREIDMIEQYNTMITQYTVNQHKYAATTAADSQTFFRVSTPDMRWGFHRIGALVTATQVKYYFDDILVFTDTKFITTAPNDEKNFMLLNLALTGGSNNSPETVPPSSYYDMYVDSVKYYA